MATLGQVCLYSSRECKHVDPQAAKPQSRGTRPTPLNTRGFRQDLAFPVGKQPYLSSIFIFLAPSKLQTAKLQTEPELHNSTANIFKGKTAKAPLFFFCIRAELPTYAMPRQVAPPSPRLMGAQATTDRRMARRRCSARTTAEQSQSTL